MGGWLKMSDEKADELIEVLKNINNTLKNIETTIYTRWKMDNKCQNKKCKHNTKNKNGGICSRIYGVVGCIKWQGLRHNAKNYKKVIWMNKDETYGEILKEIHKRNKILTDGVKELTEVYEAYKKQLEGLSDEKNKL